MYIFYLISPATAPVTTNITTLSFPFTMTTSSADTMSTGTLNIVPIGATQMPTITTTPSGFDASDLITTIPVSLSIQRSPSMRSINDFSGNENADVAHNLNGSPAGLAGNGNGGGGLVATTNNAILTIKPLNGGGNISRNNSFNANLNLNLQDSYILERNASMRSAGQPVGNSVTDGPTTAARDASIEGRAESIGASGASAPTTMAKRTPEPAKGTKEVYV